MIWYIPKISIWIYRVSVAILVDSAFDFSRLKTGDEEAFSPEPLSEEDRLKKVFGSPAANRSAAKSSKRIVI